MSRDGAPASDHPHDPWMDARVTRLEGDVGEIEGMLRDLVPMIARMDARLSDMVTKSDLMAVRSDHTEDMGALRTGLAHQRAELKEEIGGLKREMTVDNATLRTELKGDIGEIKVALADKPSQTYMWGIMTAMVPAFGCGLACLAILK